MANETTQTAEERKKRDGRLFRAAYKYLALTGETDSYGGMESRRVHREWVRAGRPTPLEFIRKHV